MALGALDTHIRLLPETERTVSNPSNAAYTIVGTALVYPSIKLILQNQTNVACSFSWDGTNSAITLAAGVSMVLDGTVTNSGPFTAAGQKIYVRASAAATGSVYISSFYAV